MTLILGRLQDKARSLHLVEQIVKQFILPGVAPKDTALIMQHLDWLRSQPDDLKVNCRFETLPASRTTRIVLDLSFAPSVAPFVRPQ